MCNNSFLIIKAMSASAAIFPLDLTLNNAANIVMLAVVAL